jgi:hypothetical protein
MSKLVIVHFSPIEWYPPLQNLIRVIEKEDFPDEVIVLSTWGRTKIPPFVVNKESKVSILRLGKSDQSMHPWVRYWYYFCFFFTSGFLLLWYLPRKILYYETISSFPVFIYKRVVNRRAKIFIHYHEYTSLDEYKSGMLLTKFFHRLEMWLYSKAAWISHTNEYRMGFFEKDIAPIKIEKKFILPNYPPCSWQMESRSIHNPLRIVYVGALSLSTMYTKEFVEWVKRQGSLVKWDIYCYNYDQDVETYFQRLPAANIKLYPGVSYDELPSVLSHYDVGVILYKGHIPNYIYNAPNKLFEYLACGLDAWFPNVMTVSRNYVTTEVFPKVVALDFDSLDNLDPIRLVDRTLLSLQTKGYFCENALRPLMRELTEISD